MKKELLILVFTMLLFQHVLFGQSFAPSSNYGGTNPDLITDPTTNNVGIGNFATYPDPSELLTVGGDIALHHINDQAERSIWGKTDKGQLSIYAGIKPLSAFLYDYGSSIKMFGYHSFAKENRIEFTSYDISNNKHDIAFLFNHYSNHFAGFVNSFIIDKTCRARFGSDAPFSDERLTVDGSIFLYEPGDQPRGILARTNISSLDLFSGSTINDGTSINLMGNSSSTNSKCILNNVPDFDGANFQFRSVNAATNTIIQRMRLDRDGSLHLSNNVDYSLHTNPNIERSINGYFINSSVYQGFFSLHSGTSLNDGSAIEMYGKNCYSYPGQIRFSSYGWTNTQGFSFVNTFNGVSTPLMGIDNNATLHVGNDIKFDYPNSNASTSATNYIRGYKTTGAFGIMANSSLTNGPSIQMFGASSSSTPGYMNFRASGKVQFIIDGNSGEGVDFIQNSGSQTSVMNIRKDGKIRIGNPTLSLTSNDYLLFVEKGIITERVHVALTTSTSWPDYVYDNDYKLMTLQEVSSYVKTNKHLPGIPSAQEVVDKGIDVADMNAKLLQKIEELTLYVLQQQKEINELKTAVKK